MGAGLHGSFRDVELTGGVGDRHTAVVAAHEHGAVVVAEPRERVGDHPRQQQLVGVVARAAVGLGRLGDGDLGAGALGAPLVDGEVAGHGEQPRADRPARLVEQPRAAPGPQQRLLEEVLRVGAVMAGQPQAVAPERAGVLVVQLLHQRHRARARAGRRAGTALGHVTSSPRRNVSGVPTVQSWEHQVAEHHPAAVGEDLDRARSSHTVSATPPSTSGTATRETDAKASLNAAGARSTTSSPAAPS